MMPSFADAQESKFELDVFVEQNIMLTDWFKEKEYNDLTENLNATDLGLRINMGIVDNKLGAWAGLSFSFRNERNAFPYNVNFFNQIDLNSYYMNSYWPAEKRKFFQDMEGKVALGLFYRIENRKWNFVPYLGVGVHNQINRSSVTYSLKKIGSNEAYNVRYYLRYNKDDYFGEDYKWVPYLTFQIKSQYKISNKIDVFGALSFNQYFTRMKMCGQLIDYYDSNVVADEFVVRGRFISTLGISLGISF